jgi:hypothetical protein
MAKMVSIIAAQTTSLRGATRRSNQVPLRQAGLLRGASL